MNTTLEQTCRICKCTEHDCSQCIDKTGRPCHWVQEDLCSACALQDTDKITFGKYKGKRLEEVPAKYFHWLWTNGKSDEVMTDLIAEYIFRNIPALMKEFSNGIW